MQPDTISILYQHREAITAVRLAAISLAVITGLTCPRPPLLLSAHLGSQTVAVPSYGPRGPRHRSKQTDGTFPSDGAEKDEYRPVEQETAGDGSGQRRMMLTVCS